MQKLATAAIFLASLNPAFCQQICLEKIFTFGEAPNVSPQHFIQDACYSPDSNLVFVANYYGSGKIIEMTRAGEVLFDKPVPVPTEKLIALPNGYLVGGDHYATSSGGASSWAGCALLDFSGDTIWRFAEGCFYCWPDIWFTGLAADPNTQAIAFGTGTDLYLLDYQGNLLAKHPFSNFGFSTTALQFFQNSDGGFTLFGTSNSGNGLMARLAADLSILWSKNLPFGLGQDDLFDTRPPRISQNLEAGGFLVRSGDGQTGFEIHHFDLQGNLVFKKFFPGGAFQTAAWHNGEAWFAQKANSALEIQRFGQTGDALGALNLGAVGQSFRSIRTIPQLSADDLVVAGIQQGPAGIYDWDNFVWLFNCKTSAAKTPGFENFKVFPNPSSGLFHLNGLPGNLRFEVSVFDILGLERWRESLGNGASEAVLDLSGLGNGTYFLVLKTAENRAWIHLKIWVE